MTADPLPPPADADQKGAERRRWSRLRWVLLVALLARLTALAMWSDNLADDRDGYLALADGLAHGRGFSVSGTDVPTAFRPPLYPMTLIPSAFLPSGVWTAALHTGLGLLTVALTWLLARRLTQNTPQETSNSVAGLAALFVALDPILLRYATLPMTETLATFLVTALLVSLATDARENSSARNMRRSATVGGLFGLAALCRPTVWAFAGLMLLLKVACWLNQGGRFRSAAHGPASAGAGLPAGQTRPPAIASIAVALTAALIVLLPWGLRNLAVFGRPILMTTHGGYTMLLGNNPDFDREVVRQPWGTVWDGSHGGGQQAWVERVNREMADAGIVGEVAQDRWLKDLAWSHITADPAMFLRACWLRLRRFWGLMPVEGASDQSPAVRWSVGAFYGFVFIGAILAAFDVKRWWSPAWWPPLLMTAAFVGAHLVYWTNTRMRAPIIPVIAVLAAIGWCRLVRYGFSRV